MDKCFYDSFEILKFFKEIRKKRIIEKIEEETFKEKVDISWICLGN